MFYDTHAHLDHDDFQPDIAAVLARAQNAGIARIISIGTDLDSSRRAVALAEAHPMVYATVGWHPDNAQLAPADIRPALRELAGHPKVVAIGECGLDYYRLPSTRGGTPAEDADYQRKQAEIFQQQLEVAIETRLNCIIHQRASFDDLVAQIRPCAHQTRGVFHCFGENLDRLQTILGLGWLVSYTGIVTFKNRHTHGVGRESVAMSHAALADLIGISRRSVQIAVAHLAGRRLIRQRKTRPTAVPVYTVLTPWIRAGTPDPNPSAAASSPGHAHQP